MTILRLATRNPGWWRGQTIGNSAVFRHQSTRQVAFLMLLSIAIVTVSFQVQGHLGLSLSDEGFLWYGAQRAMLGEVPIRDFMAYDPGRYYWSAAIMGLLGNKGVVANRTAVAVFQAIGVFFYLWILVRNKQTMKGVSLILAVSTFILWMYPRHKLFDVTLSIVLVAILSHCIEQPSRQRFFLTGFVIGLVAVFGRNHGVYGVLGTVGAMTYLMVEHGRSSILAGFRSWLVGVILGYLPIVSCMIVFPGFASAFWESIQFLFEIKGTNLPLPIPWPWKVDFQQNWLEAARGLLLGSFFVLLLVFGVLGLGLLILSKIRRAVVSPILVAAVLLTLPYAHFAFSRADVNHLAQGIFPFLIGVLILLAGSSPVISMTGVLMLFAASLIVMLPQHPGWQFHQSGNWMSVTIAGDRLTVDPATANDVALLSKLVEKYASNGRPFLVMPYWPGAYAVFERKAPVWEIYALFPRSAAFQEKEIQKIKTADPGFALLLDYALDGREETRFRNRYPLIDEYIKKNFKSIKMPQENNAFRTYVRKRIKQ